MNHQLTGYQGNSFVDSVWTPFQKGEFYYSPEPATNVADLKNADVKFYPNPAETEITFKFDFHNEAYLQVYNLSGNLVQTVRVQNNKPLNIEQLSDGLYLFRLTGDGNHTIFSEKILVK